MLGIILCGGKSLRMGNDKGLLFHQDEVWAQVAYDKLRLVGLPVKLSVNAAQQEDYAKHFGFDQLIVDAPSLAIKGPLLGLLSAHSLFPEEDLFLLACDLLAMEFQLLEKLLHEYASTGSFDAYIFKKGGQQEPICGIYTAQGQKKIMQKLKTTGLEKHSMKYILSNLQVFEIELDGKDEKAFTNFNSHADLNGL